MAAWFHRPLPRPGARLRLVCLPCAGGGTAVFRGWPAHLPSDVELVAVRLPGRESRIRERPYREWPSLTGQLARLLAEEIRPPYVLFGHSMGGMLAYEVTCRVTPVPERLILAGCRAPDVPPPLPLLHGLPEHRFHEEVHRLAGTPPEVLGNAALLALLTPMLRADLRLAETWPPEAPPRPVPVPLTTFDGADDPMAPPAVVARWRHHAPHGVRAHHLPGGHFFPAESAPAFLRLLSDELDELTESEPTACDRDPRTSPTSTNGSARRYEPS